MSENEIAQDPTHGMRPAYELAARWLRALDIGEENPDTERARGQWESITEDMRDGWYRIAAVDVVDAVAPLLAERYRAQGRAEANNAICWNTTCVGCARLLDQLYDEFARGEMTGYQQAADDIARTLGTGPVKEALAIAKYLREHSIQVEDAHTNPPKEPS